MARKRRALSVSQIELFESCPWSYREQKILHRKTLDPDYFVFGRMEHAAVQAYINHLIREQREQDPAAAKGAFMAMVAEYREQISPGLLIPTLRLLESFARRFRLDLDRVWKPEAETCLTWDRKPCAWDDEDVGLRMKLDLTYVSSPTAKIIDFKTSWAIPTEAVLENSLQTRTYAMGLNAYNPDLQHIETENDYIRFGAKRSCGTFGPADHDETWALWLAISDRVERKLDAMRDERAWKPTPGSHCYTCLVRTRCPLLTANPPLGDLIITTEEEAVEAAARALVADAVSKAHREALKLWSDQHGEVAIGDQVFKYRPRSHVEYDTHAIVVAARELGIEPSAFMRIDSEEIKRKRFQRQYPLLLDEIRVHAIPDVRTEYRLGPKEERPHDQEEAEEVGHNRLDHAQGQE
jgi:PD-(D/E)XK nuclease superfamily